MKEKKFSRNWRKKALTALFVSLTLSTVGGVASCKEEETPQDVPGLGVFYYDTGADEYQLALEDNYKATFIAKGESKTATYSIEGNLLKLKFDKDGSEMTATLGEDALTLSYDNGEYKFFKKIYYTVFYDEVGGSDVADATVVNGQTFAKPADPQKAGYEFLGWYADSEYKTPYSFAQIVTGNITLYAQWALVDPSMAEYTVDFDLGYEAEKPANMTTYAGKLYNVPTPTRAGYKFLGWWVSMYEDGSKLTYKYNADTVFTANTTLFAQWEVENLGSKLSAPEVEVGDNVIEWNGVQGVSVYKLKVTGPRGFNTVDEDVSGTSYTVDFANAPEGDYEITLTAVAQSGAENNSDTVKRYYKNKAVGRVSQFTVLDGDVLLFNRVDNADMYYITVDCGNDAHSHTTYNIGDSTYYNFSACDMQEGGIKFTVTAAAEGLAPTTSETFVYNRVLDEVTGLSVDEDTQTLSWYPVKNATNYIVTVSCGDNTHTHQVVNNGSKTSFSLKECPADANGKVKVSVYAQTAGYNSPEATEYVYDKTKLAAPGNISFNNVDGAYKLTWKAVTGATEYTVKIDNVVLTATTNELDITTALTWVDEATYNVEIKAKNATNESVWSETLVVRYGAMNPSLKYKAGVVTWKPAVGATGYQVRVNSGEIQSYGADVTSATVEFTQEGTNTIYVRCVDSTRNYYSSWVETNVENVQSIVYDSRGGSPVDPMYKVIGDKLKLPTPTKDGYTFAGWYNTPKGPESNGSKYDDEYFAETQELVLYAYWTPAKYNVTYEVGTDGEMTATTGSVTYTKSYKLAVPTVSDGSKVFLGWFAGPDAGAQQLTDDRGNSLKNWNLKQGATVYAHYVTDVLSFTLLEDGTYSVSKARNVNKVTSITIPETYNNIAVTVVEGYAFQNCSKLVSVTMPDTIKIVERETAFYLCRALQEINVYHVDGNNTAVFSSNDGVLLHKNDITGQTELFYYPSAKKGTYEIPEGVTEIPLNLFRGSQITEVVIPTSVAIIRGNAFRECAALEKVTFVEGGTDTLTIEDGAFNSCTSLVEITLPSRLAELQLNEETRTLTLFTGCEALQYVNVEKGSAYYGSVDGVLTNSGKTKILYCPAARTGSYTVPRGIVEIGESAFYECKKLTEIVIPGYVEVIEDYAFYGCSKVSRVLFDEGAIDGMELTIGAYAFADMTNLKAVEFEDGSAVSTIGEYAFANATNLRTLKIPATMTMIGDCAFENAATLMTVAFEENGKDLTFGNYVFNDCKNLLRVELPASVVKLNLGVFDGCVNISEIKVHEDNEMYKDDDGIVFSKDGAELVFFPKGRKTATGEYDIPTGVTSISEGAFKGMRYITKIVIDNTITHIGKNAFANSLQLSDLTFESGNDDAKLTIGENAFEGCSKIQTVTLPTRTEIINAKAFYNVSISSVSFPAGLTTIGDYAFSRSSLTSVEIPAGLTTLGQYVFADCAALQTVTFATGFNAKELPVGTFKGSALTAIEIPGSIEKIGYEAFNGCVSLSSVTFAAGTADLIIGYAPETTDGSADAGKGDGKGDGKGESAGVSGVFDGCTALGIIEIPDRTIYIGDSAFANCKALTTVTINTTSNLQRMGMYAFRNCEQLKSIYIPKTVQNTAYVDEQTTQEYAIGMGAFDGCYSLSSVTFAMDGTGDLSFGSYAFSSAQISTIELPKRIAPIYVIQYGYAQTYEAFDKYTFNNSLLSAINVQEGGEYYASNDGVFYKVKNDVLDELMIVPGAKTGTLTVPKTVSRIGSSSASNSKISAVSFEDSENADGVPLTIGANAFTYCSNLVEVIFPERTVALENSVFYDSGTSNLKKVYLPANVESIGEHVFRDCESLTTVEFAEDIKITSIPANTFWGCSALTAIKVPASVETIGQYAFRGCSSVTDFSFAENSRLKTLSGGLFQGMPIKNLKLPDSVTNLDSNVFNGMTQLETLWLPAGFTQISTVANGQNRFLFNGCSALKAVDIDENNQYFKSVDGVVYTKDGKTLVYYPSAKPVGSLKAGVTPDATTGEYKASDYDGKYTTPAGVQTIGTYAFQSNRYLKELTISADLLYIQREAFSNYSAYGYETNIITDVLSKLTFAERTSTLSLGDYAFYGCYRLGNYGADTLYIPAEVEISGKSVFANTRYGYVEFEDDNTTTSLDATFYNGSTSSYLKEVKNIPSSVSAMNQTFYGCKALTKVEWAPGGYVDTMQCTFYNCTSLVSIDLPAIGSLLNSSSSGAFQGCTALQSVTMTECGFIGDKAFYGCTALESFDMPASVSQMGNDVFYGCTSLESVTLSSGLENIGANAFYGCSALTSIEIGGFVTSIADNAFYGCSALTSVTLPDGLVSIGNNAFDGAALVEEIVLPDSLESIGDYAFNGWASLTSIDLPASVKTIGRYAFSGCGNVEEINIPEGALLESIGDYAFEGMAKMTEFFIPAMLTDLGIGVFTGWTALDNIVVEGGNLEYAYDGGILYNATYTKMIIVTPNVPETLTIPSSVTSLAKGVFAGLTFKHVVLPDTIFEIPDEAFRGCTNLQTIKLPTYLETIGYAAFEGCTSLESITIPASVRSTFDRRENIWVDEKAGESTLMGYYTTEMVDGIGKYAFANCTNLETVTFEAGGSERLSFGDYAFYNCSSLKSISIPNRVRTQAILIYNVDMLDPNQVNFISPWGVQHQSFVQGIGLYCFAMCTDLESVVFEETGVATFSEGLVIRVGAFTGCTSLESVQFNSAIRDYKESTGGRKPMEASIHAIQGRAFDGCTALTNVTFVQTDHQVTVRNTAFEDSTVEMPSYVTVNTDSADYYEDEYRLFLYGCRSCAFYTSNPGGECTGFNPVGDGVVKSTDIMRNVVVTDSSRMWGSGSSRKNCVYAFNGLDEAYSVGSVEQVTNLNADYKYKYTYEVVSYDEATGIVTLLLTGTNSKVNGEYDNNPDNEYGKQFYATVDLNAKTFTLGSEVV